MARLTNETEKYRKLQRECLDQRTDGKNIEPIGVCSFRQTERQNLAHELIMNYETDQLRGSWNQQPLKNKNCDLTDQMTGQKPERQLDRQTDQYSDGGMASNILFSTLNQEKKNKNKTNKKW